MPAIGITGGICTGKSTFCECLREILPAAKFFNADQAAHALFELPEVKQEIRDEFGSEVFSSGETLCDRVVVVACSYKVQLGRLMERMSIKASEAEQMINSQMPLEEKIRRGDHVAWNNSDRATLAEQAQFLVALWQKQSWTKK